MGNKTKINNNFHNLSFFFASIASMVYYSQENVFVPK